ncbi:VCBS domain-containing protein, partial [Legionella feeleii]
MSKTIPGIVDSLNGLLIKSNAGGQLSIAKNGTHVMKGEQLLLLSGDALLHAVELGDFKLAINTPFNLDGISPLLKSISQSSQADIANLIQKAVDNGIDPVALLETLEETAAGEGPVLGSGGSTFVYEPTYGVGSVTAGFDTFSANIQELNGTEIPNILLPPGQEAILAEVDAATAAGNIPSITGINSVAQIGGVATAAVTEDTNVANNNLASSGRLTIVDVDAGQSSFIAQPSVAGTYGTFTLAADGAWTYTANNAQTAIQQLGAGQTLTESFTATSADGSASQTVTVTITGTNDVPEIGGVATAAVTEDTNVANNNLTSGGTLTIADVDAGQSSFIAQPSVAGTYGTFTLAANGAWTYTANNAQAAIQQLGAGQTLTDSFTATSLDGTATKLVTVTIQGTNDVPVIAGVSTGTVTEDANVANNNVTSGGTLTIADVDAGQSSFIAQPSVAGT